MPKAFRSGLQSGAEPGSKEIEHAQSEAAPSLIFVRVCKSALGELDRDAADRLGGPWDGPLAHEIEREIGRLWAIEQVECHPRARSGCDDSQSPGRRHALNRVVCEWLLRPGSQSGVYPLVNHLAERCLGVYPTHNYDCYRGFLGRR